MVKKRHKHPPTAQNRATMPTSSKGEKTRQKILKAARHVFTKVPFKSASIRMISDKADVKHPLVLHYFGSKPALFKQVATELEVESMSGYEGFLDYLLTQPPEKAIHTFFKGVIRNGFQKPDAYRTMMLNAGEPDRLGDMLPGLDHIRSAYQKNLEILGKHLLGGAPLKETEMFMHVYMTVMSNFIGAQTFHRKVLNLRSASEYEDWVETTLKFVLIPVMQIISGKQVADSKVYAGFRQNFDGKWKMKKQSQNNLHSHSHPLPYATTKRGDKARRQIIKAARQVFSSCPYDVASIRTIGKIGNFDYSKIHHLFPTKLKLFEAVTNDAFEEFKQASLAWHEGFSGIPPEKMFIQYLKRSLCYCFENPEVLGLLIHNIGHYDRSKNLPIFKSMVRVQEEMLERAHKLLPIQAPFDMINRWLYTIVMTGYTFVGAPAYPARVFNIKPNSDLYRNRVSDTLLFVFMPSFLSLISIK